jgi:hypothetical protein
VGAALLPLLLRQRRLDLTDFITQSSLARRIVQVAKQFVVGYSSPSQTVVVIVAAVLVVVALGLVYARLLERERRAAMVAAVVGGTAVGLPVILALAGADYLDTRNVLGAWLPLMLVLAIGLGARRAGRTGLVATAGLCAVGLFVSISVWANPAYQREDDRGLAEALGPPTVPRAIVLTPINATVPLGIYTKPFERSVIPVREVDLVALPTRSSLFSGAKPPARYPNHPVFTPGMKLVETKFTDQYSLIRFRSDKPVLLQPSFLSSLRLDPRNVAVLYQR